MANLSGVLSRSVGRPTRSGLVPFAILSALALAVAVSWRDLIDFDGSFDPLLTALWLAMGASVFFCVSLRKDLLLVGVATLGGYCIEWWGTHTATWTYYTSERPPLWIIPAWPAAAIMTERLSRPVQVLAERIPTKILALAFQMSMILFLVAMRGFSGPLERDGIASVAVFAFLLFLAVYPGAYPVRTSRFVAGSVFGLLLEYWGTSRGCWTYHVGGTPPATAAFAHGVASVAFLFVTDLFDQSVYSRVLSTLTSLGRPKRQ